MPLDTKETVQSERADGEVQNLTSGPIGRELWRIAWPMMLSIFFYTLYNLVDAFWVSKISAEAVAAVSVSQISLFIMMSLAMGLMVGSGVIMAMHIGAKNINEAERVLGQSFVLSTLAAIFFTVISLIFRHEILIASGATGTIYAPAMKYFTITAGGSFLLFWLMTFMFAFNSEGDTASLTKLFAISTIVNVILDPVFIFGLGGLPTMGITGAAYATLISMAIFNLLALWSLSRDNRFVRFRWQNLTCRWESVKKILAIGLPTALTNVLNPLGLAALMFITSLGFHEAGVIAFSIGFRVEFFAMLPAIGFSFGVIAMMGQNIGAMNFTRAKEVFRLSLIYSFFLALALGILAIAVARPFAEIFATDNTVISYVVSYICIIGLSYGFLAATMIEASGFQAVGKSWPGFWIFFVRFFVISIPLAYVVIKFGLPIWLLWGAVVTGSAISSIIGWFWIRRELKNLQEIEVPVHPEQPVII